ncbi:MAG TPA: acetyl-CoA carboxylase biotin carboxyl carrier protein [Acidisarcina sp.]
MNPEELKELKELVEFLKSNQIGEFDLERGEMKVRIKFAHEVSSSEQLAGLNRLLAESHSAAHGSAGASAGAGAGAAPGAPLATVHAEEDVEAALHVVKSPIVGTFYESSSPGAAPFVSIGDRVESGQVLCIVEAMKLMNEIESDAAGEVVKRFVQSGQPIEYGQPLFALRLS